MEDKTIKVGILIQDYPLNLTHAKPFPAGTTGEIRGLLPYTAENDIPVYEVLLEGMDRPIAIPAYALRIYTFPAEDARGKTCD